MSLLIDSGAGEQVVHPDSSPNSLHVLSDSGPTEQAGHPDSSPSPPHVLPDSGPREQAVQNNNLLGEGRVDTVPCDLNSLLVRSDNQVMLTDWYGESDVYPENMMNLDDLTRIMGSYGVSLD